MFAGLRSVGLLKDTHREKALSNKRKCTPQFRKCTNMSIWVVGTTNQLFLISDF